MSENKENNSILKYTELKDRRENKKHFRKNDIVKTIPDKPHLVVASTTVPEDLAKALYGCIMTHTWCQMSGLLEMATYNMVKAFTLARAMCAPVGVELNLTTGFIEPRPIGKEGKPLTGFVFTVKSNLIKDNDGKVTVKI